MYHSKIVDDYGPNRTVQNSGRGQIEQNKDYLWVRPFRPWLGMGQMETTRVCVWTWPNRSVLGIGQTEGATKFFQHYELGWHRALLPAVQTDRPCLSWVWDLLLVKFPSYKYLKNWVFIMVWEIFHSRL